MTHARQILLLAALSALAPVGASAANIVFGTLDASLTTGSLAGTNFDVVFSYDASQVNPTANETYISLNSFDFTLLGTPFDKAEIFEGGQVMFEGSVLTNVTASYQVDLPPGAPVENITFGFGGPGSIGYIDSQDDFGSGSFTFAPAGVAPEPATLILAMPLAAMLFAKRFRRTA